MVEEDRMRNKGFWENFILTAIVLVIIHTFLYDLGALLRWRVSVRNIVILTGLFFDTLFTVEFIVRSVIQGKKKGLITYWLYNRGWADFLSSVPILFFSSGPQVLLLCSGRTSEGLAAIGVLNILKIVKAIRVTRVLRLIRVMKIFGKIKNADSVMAQHHTATISTIAVSIVIFVIIIFTLLAGDPLGNAVIERRNHYEDLVDVVRYETDDGDLLMKLLQGDELGLRLSKNGTLLFSKVPITLWDSEIWYEDYMEIERGGYALTVSLEDINIKSALYNIRVFGIILSLVAGFMLFYTRHFVQIVTDVLFVVNRGFKERGYTLQVKIPKQYADHEIFELARFYNDRYLPAKLKNMHKSKRKKQSSLSMDDLLKYGNQKSDF
ncbi:MAG: ion transporter [Spirochaetes bacterium]|nr:ion transporter [Spirochaetota bacterium]